MVYAADTPIPSPLAFNPSGNWDGNDGNWSSFVVQIGSPPQPVLVLPSTSASSLWVVLPQGCDNFDPSTCPDNRGNVFNPNASTTWVNEGLFGLPDFSEQAVLPSIYTANSIGSDVGLDNITLDWSGNGGPTLQNQTIAAYAAKDFYIGSVGLSPYPTNVTYTEEFPSLLSTLRNQSIIPSLSYGYTAGAIYKERPAFGSLTFGGYDATRSGSQNVTVPMSEDQDLKLVISIESITSGNNSLLSSPVLALIDSTVSQVWLPISACAMFESVFGLMYDPTYQLFTLNNTLHQSLLSSNPSLSFTLSSGISSSNATLDIVLPYASLNLMAGFPLDGNATRPYFPVRCLNDSQTTFVLGRVFLQEAYLIVDYERSTFSVSQALFPDPSISSDLVPIYAPNVTIVPQSSGPSTPKSSTFPVGAIAGIAVGAVALIIAAAYFFIRRRNLQQAKARASVPMTETYGLTDAKDAKQGQQAVAYIGQKVELDAEGTTFTGHEMEGEDIMSLEGKRSPISPTSSGRGAVSPGGRSLRFSMWSKAGSGHRKSHSGGVSELGRTSPVYELEGGYEGEELESAEASADPISEFPSPEPLEPVREGEEQPGPLNRNHGFQFPFSGTAVSPQEELGEEGKSMNVEKEDVSP
ncbi:MAG: hypothetical protein MMC33_000225 [Icmadophila ericetorum]|nr:hypothetical protein [Icmadophila ericetorum]